MYMNVNLNARSLRAQGLCEESPGGRAGLPALIRLMASMDVKHKERRRRSPAALSLGAV